ncbi:hypothetical protein [Micromonospora sp. CPCC 206061]|uniref:hypothetical protein n=1 Tax=Micromonospora sp. CPCC 206061 TaxID=3122410 RepID=UPI002FF0639B
MKVRACFLCVDGMMPTGIHPIFGPVYRACPDCCTTCRSCDGTAVFPASAGYVIEILIDALYNLGYSTELCGRCAGIIGLLPFGQEEAS